MSILGAVVSCCLLCISSTLAAGYNASGSIPTVSASSLIQDLPRWVSNSTAGRSQACNLLIAFDEPLWEHFERNYSHLVDVAQRHVNGLNDLFIEQLFTSENEADQLYFRLARVQVMFGSCDGFENENCTEYREQYLKVFDQLHDFSHFCLAYMFTYIDFNNGTAGLASIGTLCRPIQNSGFITLLNHGSPTDEAQSILTFAHEVGHNFNAIHDENTEDAACKGKGFIMSEVAKAPGGNSTEDNSRKFSPCSLKLMAEKLKSLSADEKQSCFKTVQADRLDDPALEASFCGNRIVEPGEACDCGWDDINCNDDCCYPAQINYPDRYANQSAVPCQTNRRYQCRSPPALIYAIYVPFFFIGLVSVLTGLLLRWDWRHRKILFHHVTKQSVRIVQ